MPIVPFLKHLKYEVRIFSLIKCIKKTANLCAIFFQGHVHINIHLYNFITGEHRIIQQERELTGLEIQDN